jgi:hypothetical protein
VAQSLTLPYGYVPRPYQLPLWNHIQNGGKRAISVWHRRAGKDVNLWNMMICQAFQKKGQYFYFYPEYNQGRKAIWEGHCNDGRRFKDFLPPVLIERENGQEMFIRTINGSSIQIVGTDKIDSIMSSNPIGCVFSEFSLQNPAAWDFVRPILKVNGGWAVFNFTPRGLNHAWELYQMAMDNDDWFCERLAACNHPEFNPGKVPATNVLSVQDIEDERKSGMSDSLVRQEYFCDFQASSDDILIPIELIESAVDRIIGYHNAPMVAGLDVGLSLNGDPSAICIRQGGRIICLEEARYDDYDKLAGWVYKHMASYGCSVVYVDGIGWGAGAAHALRKLYPHFSVNAINVAESASADEQFSRLRDEIWWRAREWFEARQCSLPRSLPLTRKLIAELSSVRYDWTTANKVKVMSKVEMKKAENGGKSPNLADAFCLAVYGRAFEVSQKNDESTHSYLVA